MKKSLVVLMCLLMLLYTGCGKDSKSSSPVGGTDIFMVISSNLDGQKLEEARRFILHTLFEVMDSGDRLTVFDAGTQAELAQFSYPAAVDLKTTRLKKTYVEKEWARFLAYCAKIQAGEPQPAGGGLNIPRLGRMLADRLVVERRQLTEVVFIGSPLHRDDRHPEFSFGKDEWLSDAVFVQETPFRVPDADKGRFEQVRFHFVFVENPFADLKLQDKIQRFWSLWTSLQGGGLVTFTSDSKAYRRIKTDIAAVRYELDPADTLVIARHTVNESAVAKQAPAPDPSEGKFVISARWENRSSDIDLVAILDGHRLNYKSEASWGLHLKHLVTGSEEIVTSFNPDLIIQLEHVNGPPPGTVVLTIFKENDRLANVEYKGFQRYASYNITRHDATWKLTDLVGNSETLKH